MLIICVYFVQNFTNDLDDKYANSIEIISSQTYLTEF